MGCGGEFVSLQISMESHTPDTRPTRLCLIGSTGSIGTQTLDIVTRHPDIYSVSVLAAGSQVDRLIEQAVRFRPQVCVIARPGLLDRLTQALKPLGIECQAGEEALCETCQRPDVDMVVTATVGYSGLAPTLAAIRAGKDVALANKETLVVAGDLVNRLKREHGTHIYPIDSEHSAIWQCLQGERHADVRRLIITASGGPFLRTPARQLATVTVKDALHHPNWSMGAKITIDSATMLNKAFEIIEARWLFDIPSSKVTPLVHPQSIVHSMVEYTDGAIKAQLGRPDMHLPIAYALGRGQRLPEAEKPLDVSALATLTFEEPDTERFPLIRMGHYALERGGNTACVINAANEVAVAAFLRDEIPFPAIADTTTHTLGNMSFIPHCTYDDYVATNQEARAHAQEFIMHNSQFTIHK